MTLVSGRVRKDRFRCFIIEYIVLSTACVIVVLLLRSRSHDDASIDLDFDSVMSSALETANEILSRRPFYYVVFINFAYVEMAKSFVCNLKTLDSGILSNVLFFTDGPLAHHSLKAFDDRLSVFPVIRGHTRRNAVDFGTVSYFNLTLHRLKIQNYLLQQRGCLMMLEVDSTWFSADVDVHLRRLFEDLEIVSGDNYKILPELKEISAGFSGYCSSVRVRDLFDRYTSAYEKLVSDLRIDDRRLSHSGEQVLLSRMLKNESLKVTWLDVCDFATGVWYENIEYAMSCPRPKVIQNNYIIGLKQKIERVKYFHHWFINSEGKCRTAAALAVEKQRAEDFEKRFDGGAQKHDIDEQAWG